MTITKDGPYASIVDSGLVFIQDMVWITSTTAIIVGENFTDDVLAQIIQISGGSLTSGSLTTIDNTITSMAGGARVARLSSTKVAIAYADAGVSGYAMILDISGTTITTNTRQTFAGGGAIDLSGASYDICVLSTSKIVCCYRDFNNSNHGYAEAATVTGSSIGTFGTAVNFEANIVSNIECAGNTSSLFSVAYRLGTSSLDAIAATVSGTTITFGTAVTIDSVDVLSVKMEAIDSTRTALTWMKNSGPSQYQNYAGVYSISGTTITSGALQPLDYVISPGQNQPTAISLFDSENLLTSWNDTISTDESYASDISVSGTSIVPAGSRLTIQTGTSDGIGVAVSSSQGIYVDDSTEQGWIINLAGAGGGPSAGTYVLGFDIDKENDGQYGWMTLWRSNNLYLQKWDLDAMTGTFEISLGAATWSQVENREKVAFPYVASDDQLWIYGNMDAPAFLTGTHQLIETSTGGASGTWASFNLSWGSDVLGALFVSGDTTGSDDRLFYGVRNKAASKPDFYYGLNALNLQSTIPVSDGTKVKHGSLAVSQRGEVALGLDTYAGTGVSVIASIDDGSSWVDVTYNLPSGTTSEVLRYL